MMALIVMGWLASGVLAGALVGAMAGYSRSFGKGACIGGATTVAVAALPCLLRILKSPTPVSAVVPVVALACIGAALGGLAGAAAGYYEDKGL